MASPTRNEKAKAQRHKVTCVRSQGYPAAEPGPEPWQPDSKVFAVSVLHQLDNGSLPMNLCCDHVLRVLAGASHYTLHR